MPKYFIDAVESLDGKPGLRLVSYRVEGISAKDALDKFYKGLSEVVYEGIETDAVMIGIEEIKEEDGNEV